ISKNTAAHAEHHWAVAMKEQFEGNVILMVDENVQQFAVGPRRLLIAHRGTVKIVHSGPQCRCSHYECPSRLCATPTSPDGRPNSSRLLVHLARPLRFHLPSRAAALRAWVPAADGGSPGTAASARALAGGRACVSSAGVGDERRCRGGHPSPLAHHLRR